ncbi:hypothetical protein Leryth_010506 [Lithospermum erythrorhizon]|nr:hypothetical protein Leryth_010506 [Lithospermum erythrorhizon]
MEEEEGGPRLSKRFSDKGGEVDLKTKAGTAWSHNFLNQKPWHPLSYPNQRRKWIAEQTFAEKQRRAQEVAREDFFRQAALVSKKEKEKMEMMKAVSFMYIRPPGYNAESAKAAEIADENNKEDQGESDPSAGASSSKQLESLPPIDEKKKVRPKDVFGRHLPTGEQFEVLKNAPNMPLTDSTYRMETGIHGRAKPFGIEIRNVKCVRCGNFGHQSGDRECPLKDVLMPNEESRLKRDDPLTAILAQTEAAEMSLELSGLTFMHLSDGSLFILQPLKWELKQKPGLSPPRGGFDFDDANQQIVAEDIFDEYGGFLSGEMPELLANFSSGNPKKKKTSKRNKKKHFSPRSAESSDGEENASLSEDDHKKSSKKRKNKRQLSPTTSEASDEEKSRMYSETAKEKRSKKLRKKKSGKHYSDPSTSEDDHDRHCKERSKCSDHLGSNSRRRSRHCHHQSSDDDLDRHEKSRNKRRRTEADSSDHSDSSRHRSRHRRHHHRHRASRSSSPAHSDARGHHRHHRRR